MAVRALIRPGPDPQGPQDRIDIQNVIAVQGVSEREHLVHWAEVLGGAPGDAIFCNPGLLLAVVPNRSDEPRFLRVKFLFP